MHILRYLKSAPGKGILFTKNGNHEDIDVCQMLIRLEHWMIDDQCQVTSHLWVAILLHGEVKNKMSSPAQVQKLNSEVWHLVFVKAYG